MSGTASSPQDVTGDSLGIGTTTPRSIAELQTSAAGSVGPILTITNAATTDEAGQPVPVSGSAVAIDLNPYPPPPSSSKTVTIPVIIPTGGGKVQQAPGEGPASQKTENETETEITTYNPAARIEAVYSAGPEAGNLEFTDIVFLSSNPGAPDQGLRELLRLTLFGAGVGTSTPLAVLHVAPDASQVDSPGILVQADSATGASPRVGLVDTSKGTPQGAPAWFVDNSADTFRVLRQPNVNQAGEAFLVVVGTGHIGAGTSAPLAPLHVTAPAGTGGSDPVVLIEADSASGPTPRVGLVDTTGGGNAATAPAWFIDNSADTFRIFRQSNVSTNGEAFLTIDNTGNITVPGDIVLSGADCAERFRVVGAAEPGTVVVLDETGGVKESVLPYDTKVAGVVSGAGASRPGIILGGATASDASVPLALSGTVYCKVDARVADVNVGDLLTTSETPGHAMRATDPLRAFGAVLGKALGALHGGQGMIPVLVSLR